MTPDAMKLFAEACERNKQPILEVLVHYLPACRTVLEIGSGTGQHAVFFARQFPHLIWQTSDLEEIHPGILAWLDEAKLANLRAPLSLDVDQAVWPNDSYDCVFSANTAHIMGWPGVCNMIRGISRVLATGGIFCLYGPFNYQQQYTSASNARFDQWLKSRDPASGIRNYEDLEQLSRDHGLIAVADHPMPANNRLLVFRSGTLR